MFIKNVWKTQVIIQLYNNILSNNYFILFKLFYVRMRIIVFYFKFNIHDLKIEQE